MGSARGGYPVPGGGAFEGMSARSRNSGEYLTPDPSARSSAFLSVYDASSSTFSSARDQYGTAGGAGGYGMLPLQEPRGSRRTAPCVGSAFGENQADAGAAHSPAAAAEASVEPRRVFSMARHGRHRDVEASLQAGFDPNHVDSFGNTIFHVACQNGNKRIAKAAIKYGGCMDSQNSRGNTGLHFLYAYGYPEVAEYFMSKGASDHILNESGQTPPEGIR